MYSTFELSLPICAIVFSMLLIIVYYSKKRVKLLENKMYGVMLFCVLIDSILVTIEKGLVVGKTLSEIPALTAFCVCVLNRFDAITLIVLTTCLYMYIHTITLQPSKKMFNKNLSVCIFTDSIIIISIFFLDLHLITNGEIISISGNALYPIYIASIIYILLSIGITLLNIKKITKKHIPLIISILIFIFLIVIFMINPYLTVISILLTFVNYVMYHTIENPDMNMLEEVHRAKEISDNANEEKTLFIYNMTNDIRSITKDIDDSADYILDEIDNKKVDKELIKETARDIKGSTAKFTTMTNEILDISSIDTSSIKVYNNKYNIKLLLKQLVTNYKEKCKDKGLSFRSNIDTTLPQYLYGDSVSLKKVIDILLENSYKYTEKGYIELSVNTIIKNDIARLIITVEDSGTGMKVEELNKALNNKKEEDSTNLNNSLYNAKKLITLMNGTIVPSSTYGSGTSIKIILDQKVYEEKSKTSKYNKELDKKRVLLVDDNISSQKLFTKILSGTNIELDIVSLGKECLDKIRNKEKYDLILLDEEMKPLNGIEVITKLKNIKNFNTKVVLLTKNNDYEYNEDYLKYGFIDYILKPLDKTKVLDKIGKYLK